MTFPDDTKEGDLFWLNNEPVRVTAWNYRYGVYHDRFFDLQFIEYEQGVPQEFSIMTLIPMDYDFYGVEIRPMTDLEKELF